MKTKNILSFAVVALLTFALTGCRTKRVATEDITTFSKKQRTEMLAPLAQYTADVQAMSANTSIALNFNGLSATIKGKLRMRRDKEIQMTITALGLMEIACIEFTPKAAYVIDRVNKRYAVLDYSSGILQNLGLSFSTVQALFWNRLFIPGEEEVWNNTGDFVVSSSGTQRLVEPSRQRMLKCQFYTNGECTQLQQTNLNLRQYAVTWRYDEFEAVGNYNYTYPVMHDISLNGSSRALGARVSLTGVSTLDTGWKGSSDLSRYKQVDFEQLLSILNMIR